VARAVELGRVVENALIVALLGGLVLLGSVQIVLRNVFSTGVTWGDGLMRLLVLWLALLGALAASRDGRHITMGAATRLLPPRLQLAAGILGDVFAAAVSAAFAWSAWRFVSDSRLYGDVLLNGVPAWMLQLVMPVVFALIAYRYLASGARRWRER
jgi:TRAP-type C4-dicarboxylate transport system permease small subunit